MNWGRFGCIVVLHIGNYGHVEKNTTAWIEERIGNTLPDLRELDTYAWVSEAAGPTLLAHFLDRRAM